MALLSVKVAPGARQSEIVGRHGSGIKVRVAAVAEDGRANRALIELLARALSVPKSAVYIVRGQTSKDKVLEIAELSLDEVLLRLGV